MKHNNVKRFFEYGHEVLVTNCKKVGTAVRRFDSFLSDYDNYIRENVLRAFMNVEVVGYISGGDIAFHGFAVSDDCRCDVFYTDLSGVYSVEISFFSNDTSEDTTDTSEDTTDTSEDTTDTSEDTTDTSEDTTDTSEDTTDTITICCDRRKRVIVKPVRISPRSCYPVRISPYGMPADYYPYKMFVDGLEMWDCRSHSYNEYLSDLIGAPPYDSLPF